MRLIAVVLTFASLGHAEERTIKMVNIPTVQGSQEIATVLRTVDDIPKLTIDPARNGFTVEANPALLDAAEWLIRQVDKPAGWQPSLQERTNVSAREHVLPASERLNVMRIYYLPAGTTVQGMQETLTILRLVLDLEKVFNYSPMQVLAYRGTAAQLDAAEWLLQTLDTRTVSEPYSFPYGKPLDVVRVFPLAPGTTAEQMTQILKPLRADPVSIKKAFTRSAPPAIAVRGTAAQLDQAQRLIPYVRPGQ